MAAPPHAKLNLRQLSERGERPFPSHPQVARYFPAAAIENARRRITRAIDRGDGPALVIGGPGTGKSLLLQVLAAQFHQRFDVVLLACTRLSTRRALLQAILFELGLPYQSRDEGHLRFSVLDHLLSAKQATAELLLLVDEAQSLPITLLDELRILTNLVHGGSPRVRVVVAGSPALEESFACPELESFSQRLAARCYVTPLAREETAQFVRAQLAASGAEVDAVLSPDACEAIFEATDGVPRLVNQVCDRAIAFAIEQNYRQLDRAIVQGAWSDLQQLPLPHETSSYSSTSTATMIEFGGLAAEQPLDGLRIHIDEPEIAPAEVSVDAIYPAPPASAGFEQHPLPPAVKKDAANPFAEPFAEEEIVLDQFAAWGDMFDVGTPQVENRRDREFAALVQQALDASGQSDPVKNQPAVGNQRPPAGDGQDDTDFRWPPLRLSDAHDTTVVKPLPPEMLGKPVPLVGLFAAPSPTGDDVDDHSHGVNSPIILIEDDVADDTHMGNSSAMRPQVRRQEYRRLFSRLRNSG